MTRRAIKRIRRGTPAYGVLQLLGLVALPFRLLGWVGAMFEGKR